MVFLAAQNLTTLTEKHRDNAKHFLTHTHTHTLHIDTPCWSLMRRFISVGVFNGNRVTERFHYRDFPVWFAWRVTGSRSSKKGTVWPRCSSAGKCPKTSTVYRRVRQIHRFSTNGRLSMSVSPGTDVGARLTSM